MVAKVLDIGAACGAIAEGIRRAGCEVSAVDLSEYMIGVARMQFPEVQSFVCDAVNMHVFPDNTFDYIHSNQVAEHWKPELVPYILREIYRVMKPGAKVIQIMDTVESFEREGRKGDTEDPTHVCIWTMAMWHRVFVNSNFLRCETQQPLFRSYKWDYVVYQKPGV